MKEDVVSPFIARIAKIKGFDWNTKTFYDENDKPHECSDQYQYCNNNLTKENTFSYNANGNDKFIMSAPTQSHLQKWARHKHKTDIIPLPLQPNIYICNVYQQTKNIIQLTTIKENRKPIIFKSYEDALDAGLLFFLKQL
jgi:hypothetical protein